MTFQLNEPKGGAKDGKDAAATVATTTVAADGKIIGLPPFLHIEKDVTGDSNYSAYSLSVRK